MHRQRSCALALAFTLALVPATAWAQDDISVSLVIKANGESEQHMTITASGDMARLDMGPEASMIWSPDWWRMLQHQERMYMEFDKAMLERMRQMMGNMPGAPDVQAEMDAFDATKMTFERTGNTDTILDHTVFEVAFSDGEGNSGSLWMTEDVEVGMFEVFARMAEHLESLAGPMMGGPGGKSPTANLRMFTQYARAQGLPDGKVLRMVTDKGDQFEVTGWESGPFGDDTWSAPAGYTKQAMPFGR